jgi:SAM-dependent methyltransferase
LVSDFDDPAFSGDRWAAVQQNLCGGPDPSDAVEFLAGLVPSGARVLELAIGGGRVALPLAQRGFYVEGIEASAAVAEQLRSTPGAEGIPVLVADMADVQVAGPYALVYLVWNGLFNLTRQERQIECFANVARVLDPDGLFVLECFVPGQGEFTEGVFPREISERSVTFTVAKDDPAAQRLTRQHITLGTEGVSLLPVALRYCWPSELDLMARLAGLRLRDRFANWTRAPFDSASPKHISVYERQP